MQDAIDSAMSVVSYDTYVRQPNDTLLPQSSSPVIIAAMLRLLNVRLGMQILEVGTGSGYSTALLASLVGKSSSIISIDVDTNLVSRAAQLLASDGLDWVQVVAGDGREGYSARALFDRIIAWATADALPETWVKQLHPEGMYCCTCAIITSSSLSRNK